MEKSFDLMAPGIKEKNPEDKEPEVMKNTFKDLGVIIGFIFIYIILYQYVSTGAISNGIDLQNDVNLILSDTQNFALVPVSDSSSSPTSVPVSDSSSSPTSIPVSDSSSSPTSIPVSGSSSSPTSVPVSGSSSSPNSVPVSGSSSSPSSLPTSAPSPVPTSVPSSLPTSAPSPVPTSVPSSLPTSAPSPVPTSVPSSLPTSAPTESPNTTIIEPKIHAIRMDINGFYPDVISINKSDTIIWTNVENQRPRVVLLSKDDLFENQVLIEGIRFEYKFYKKGNYSFALAENPSLIEYKKAKGKVIVN